MTKRHTLASDLRDKAATLNEAIVAFNAAVEPLIKAVTEAQGAYNETLEAARELADGIAEKARGQFEAKSERWQEGEKGQLVREWFERWEVSLDDVDLDLPEPLEEMNPEEHAAEIEGGPASLIEL
jgi:vacuolar-type H+-ATPase subunit H